jgi:hypothetical protein
MINCVQNLRNFNIVKRILEICLKLVDEYFVYIYMYMILRCKNLKIHKYILEPH